MAAERAERGAAAGVGEPHAAVALVLEQPLLGEPAHHPAHRRRGDAEPLGDVGRRRRAAAAALELVDRLEIVLDRGRELGRVAIA